MGRLRKIAGAEEALEKSPYVMAEPSAVRGQWAECFRTDGDLYAEIGMGKGLFLTRMAAAHPERSFVGIERYASVLLRAVQKLEEGLPNLRLICADAASLSEWFAPGELSGIYLNFSDPWPKERHAKRRLVAPGFLDAYAQAVAPGGRLVFKTDNEALFTYANETIAESANWQLLSVTDDLYADPVLAAENIQTEYEERFLRRGQKICRLEAERTLKNAKSRE